MPRYRIYDPQYEDYYTVGFGYELERGMGSFGVSNPFHFGDGHDDTSIIYTGGNAESGSGFRLDTAPGVAQHRVDVDNGFYNFYVSVSVYDGALETAALTISTDRFADTFVFGGSGSDRITSFAGQDAISSGGGADTIDAGDADDDLFGEDGNDSLVGGAGNDLMNGGLGDDRYDVDSTSDQIREATGQGYDRVMSSVSYKLSANVEELTLKAGSAAIAARGGLSDNHLFGNENDNLLDGGGGSDDLYGGAGNDIYLVDQSDTIQEQVGEGIDTVRVGISYALAAGLEIEKLEAIDETATNAIKLYGNERSQTITGNAGANLLEGRTGNDTLDGGLGNDTLNGGAGKDSFLFDSKLDPHNIDHITDFKPVDDTIRLDKSASLFVKIDGLGTLSTGQFKDITDPHAKLDGDDHILYNHDSGRLYYDADGSGSAAKLQFAILDTHPTLTASDFFVL